MAYLLKKIFDRDWVIKNWTEQKICFYKKITQFLPNHCETLSKRVTHEYLILTKFCYDWNEIVDFLIKVYFWLSPVFYYPVSISAVIARC